MAKGKKETIDEQDIAPQQEGEVQNEITSQKANTATAKEGSKVKTEEDICRELIAKEYAKNYPKNKEWHVTSDRSVFLADDLHYAKAHQKNLKGGGEVLTIKTK